MNRLSNFTELLLILKSKQLFLKLKYYSTLIMILKCVNNFLHLNNLFYILIINIVKSIYYFDILCAFSTVYVH